jgi:hypothetical protein
MQRVNNNKISNMKKALDLFIINLHLILLITMKTSNVTSA